MFKIFERINKLFKKDIDKITKESEEDEKKSPEKRFLKDLFWNIFQFGSLAFFLILPMMISITIIYGGPGDYESFKSNCIRNLTLAVNRTFNSIEKHNEDGIIFSLGKMIYFWLYAPLISIALMIIYSILDFRVYLKRKYKKSNIQNG